MSKYRLEPLLRIKARARKRTEIALAKAIGHLEREKKRKTELEEEKQNLIDTKKEIRDELDRSITSDAGMVQDSYRYIDYMRGLDEDIHQKDRDIERQEDIIEDAKVVVTRARRDYIDAAKEHKIMEKHKELWVRRHQKELARREQKEMDELGQVIHRMVQRGETAKR
jgi:flagellar export protein FliJ